MAPPTRIVFNTTTISLKNFVDAVLKYPIPHEYTDRTALTAAYKNMEASSFRCSKHDNSPSSIALSLDESYFIFLLAVDPDLNVSLAYQQTRFLITYICLSVVQGKSPSPIECAFIEAVIERATSRDLGVHVKQRAFFEMWYSDESHKVAGLRAAHRNKITSLRTTLTNKITRRQVSFANIDGVKIVLKLLGIPAVAANATYPLSQPAFKLSVSRVPEDERTHIEDDKLEEMLKALEDVDTAAKVGEAVAGLGIKDALFANSSVSA